MKLNQILLSWFPVGDIFNYRLAEMFVVLSNHNEALSGVRNNGYLCFPRLCGPSFVNPAQVDCQWRQQTASGANQPPVVPTDRQQNSRHALLK